MHPEEIHLTVAIVRYRTQGKLKTPVFMILISNDYSIENKYKMATVHSCKNYIFVYSLLLTDGKGPEHFGVASNWMNRLESGDTVFTFIRK